MVSIRATLTTKGQATIPKEVRKALDLKSGDEIVYEILNDGMVILRKVYPFDVEYIQSVNSTLNEWMNKEDDEAYRNL